MDKIFGNGGALSTGADIFLALSRLDELLSDTNPVEGFPLNELGAALVPPVDVAYVPDFMLIPGSGLCSELFTARAVGDMLIKMAVSEGVAVEDEKHGYGVRVRDRASAVLSALLVSLNECLDTVTLKRLEYRLDGPLPGESNFAGVTY